ncbi:MAG: MAPEG family protein [Pseudomonadota bacterium]|nr:MAPEG family protein [Pseudomonadota bacterium]
MSALNLVYPMFAMVLLTATVLMVLFRRRARAVRDGTVTSRYFRVYQGESEPESSAAAARHFANLFEAPVLFYAACLAAMVAAIGDVATLILAWLYVLARVIHAGVHLGDNRLRRRIAAYALSWLILLALWISIVIAVAQKS